MKPIDAIILGVLLIILGLIIYFSFWKKKEDPCKGCPYARSCESKACSKRQNK